MGKYQELVRLHPEAKELFLQAQKEYHSKPIDSNALVTVTQTNDIVEVQWLEKMNMNCPIRKLNADEYVELGTGEIKEFKKGEKRIDDLNYLRQTFKKARYLINNNFTGLSNELFITLTYAENMICQHTLKKDFEKFIKQIKYKFGKIEYINFVEPQARGAWHCHVLIKFLEHTSIYIPNKFDDNKKPIDTPLFDMWGRKGWVTIQGLGKIDNIGAYVTAYLTDIPVADEVTGKDIVVKEVNGVKKKFKKGGRLHFYPKGMRFYRKSRGIKYPERQKMYMSEAKKIVGSANPTFEYRSLVEREDFEMQMKIEQYNLSR